MLKGQAKGHRHQKWYYGCFIPSLQRMRQVFSVEKPFPSLREISRWKHSDEFWDINGWCLCQSCDAGFTTYGLSCFLSENIFSASEKVPISSGPPLLGRIPVKAFKSIEGNSRSCLEWRWEITVPNMELTQCFLVTS